MKKRFFVFVIIVSYVISITLGLYGCSKKNDEKNVYSFQTDLGDQLFVKVDLSGNFHRTDLAYFVYSDDCDGIVLFKEANKNTLPNNLTSPFETIGTYGDTNFYNFKNRILFVNEYIGLLPYSYKLEAYKAESQFNSAEYLSALKKALTYIVSSGNVDYIYDHGEILAYENSAELKEILQRYSNGDFTDVEISVNESSCKTKEEMVKWAQDILNKYY